MFERFLVVALLAAGCGSSPTADSPPVSGRRVQGTSLVAQGTVPYQLDAYELTFAAVPGVESQARRAALLVDMAAGQGSVRGFVEWGKSGDVPVTYVAGGWARQRAVAGELLTVFELALNSVDGPRTPPGVTVAERFTPLTVRLIVNEASGDVTLTRRR